MAYQVDQKKKGGKTSGAPLDPTKGAQLRPGFRYPAYRGVPEPTVKYNEVGEPLKRTGYGTNEWVGPASVSQADSVNLSDYDTTISDPALAQVKRQGVYNDDSRSHEPGSQTRDIRDTGDHNRPVVPAGHGMKSPTRADEKVPGAISDNAGTVARQPGK